MEWSKQYANLVDDPRVQAAEDNGSAGWLLWQSISYCARVETDGFIPHTQIARFGGPRLKMRVAALVREQIYVPAEGGYRLDPDLWSEERNLNDAAERKREADRRRVADKRAAERASQNGYLSRDSRATGSATSPATASATSSGDSRAPDKRRKELPPLPPPKSGGNESRCTKHKRPRRGCNECALPPLAPVPDWCGFCNPSRRMEDPVTGNDLGACPACHPSTVRESA
jgi:hypothetical protein